MALPLIKVVQLTLTNRCQCNCTHCGVSKLRNVIKGELSFGQIDLLFRDLRLAGCLVVDLFGGEPTLRQDLFEIITRGKSHGFIISLETNGYVIDQAYMDSLVAAGLDQIYLSLDDYRAEAHDGIRRRSGCFDRAVRALELGARAGLIMHVSTVPQTRDFFLNGDINRFMRFVLDHGAQKVRLLLPRFAGDSIHSESGPIFAGEEKELFSHIAAEYRDYIYLHTPGTPLTEKNICTAKEIFCHVMSNGWVAPCPYFPLVFGDATREPIIDVFERIQSHPLVRLGGEYCPMRNTDFINTYMRDLDVERPFFPIAMTNQIDMAATCRTGCSGCDYSARSMPGPADEVVRAVEKVDAKYSRIEFFGGDAFLRDDLFAILDRVPSGRKIILWSACGRLPENDFFERLRTYPIEAIKVHFPVQYVAGATRVDQGSGFEEAVKTIKSITVWGMPVHLYIPGDLLKTFHTPLAAVVRQLGVERLYAFTGNSGRPLVNSVGCFGRKMDRARILWVNNRH